MDTVEIAKAFWRILPLNYRKQFLLLLLLMMLASFLEILSIGAVLPFLSILTSPETIFDHSLSQPVIKIFSAEKPADLILPVTSLFMVAILMAGFARVALLIFLTRFSYAVGAELSNNMYRTSLYKEYSAHISQNSSEIINGIITKTNIVITGLIRPAMTLVSSIILLVGIVSALFLVDIFLSSIIFLSFTMIYLIITKFSKEKLSTNSKHIAKQSTVMVKTLQEGLGGFRDVILDGTQKFFCELYRDADLKFRLASANNVILAGIPRYILETIGMVSVVIVAYIFFEEEGRSTGIIPLLGAIVLGIQRLLPTLQQIYYSYSNIHGSKSSFSDVLSFLSHNSQHEKQIDRVQSISFNNSIILNKISFIYDQKEILKNISLKVDKGEFIGIVGQTGCGKSTLLDIVMGLLPLEKGELLVDGQQINPSNRGAWFKHISHVPQSIYLADCSIAENIAFGVDKSMIDMEKVRESAKKSQLAELIESWDDGYETHVGERGVKLSGGQRQRIGIARAFYKKTEVLFLDEATSALDRETEKLIMDSIEDLRGELTVFIIAHRTSTLKHCDKIIKLYNGNLLNVNYDEIH